MKDMRDPGAGIRGSTAVFGCDPRQPTLSYLARTHTLDSLAPCFGDDYTYPTSTWWKADTQRLFARAELSFRLITNVTCWLNTCAAHALSSSILACFPTLCPA
ncbi:hypothetical protein LshimejAT787_0900330 [Lyophyllum shimeji]|uniref:Uncharacterized protein n=1 Tax=Lyophyllum shimeji TaxID=47721 RepID=A0A9P3PSK5_LYOSH|nr:hypothetical protein LshimejAT787_0900330 [Lyophyllum shimeji]